MQARDFFFFLVLSLVFFLFSLHFFFFFSSPSAKVIKHLFFYLLSHAFVLSPRHGAYAATEREWRSRRLSQGEFDARRERERAMKARDREREPFFFFDG